MTGMIAEQQTEAKAWRRVREMQASGMSTKDPRLVAMLRLANLLSARVNSTSTVQFIMKDGQRR